MKLTREKALELHRKMWTDMQRKLGDTPSITKRADFKRRWCDNYAYTPINSCYLCEYVAQEGADCGSCPIDWGKSRGTRCVNGDVDYRYSPISEILALPEREGD